MKSLKVSALSLALLVSQVNAMEVAPVVPEAVKEATEATKVVAKSFALGEKVGEFIGKVKAKLPSMPAMPSKEEATAMVKNAPKAMKEFAQAHPYKTTAIIAATAAVAYAVYKVCTAKKAKTTKVVVVE